MTVLYQTLASQIQELIDEGVYRQGERLPGVRVLSRQFSVSVSTVLQALQLLEAKGYLTARERSGHFARWPGPTAPVPAMPESTPLPRAVTTMDQTLELCSPEPEGTIPLASAVPHRDFLPTRALQQASVWAARQASEPMEYAFPGVPAFLRQIAQRMASLGVTTTLDNILATNGCQEAIILALRALTEPGDVVAVESPSFPGVLQALKVAGLQALEIPSRPDEGISLEGLELALEQWPVKACVVVANHSNPLGVRLSDERKQRLVRMLENAGVPLIEDDIYGDMGHSEHRPRPAKAFDTSGNVIYCSSFSKTLSPGLRLGWVLTGRHNDAIRQQKFFNNLATGSLPQLAVSHLLEQGGYDRHMRKTRFQLATSSERMRSAICHWFPRGTAVSRPTGGFVLWVQLPDGLSGTELTTHARKDRIHIAPGQLFSTSGKFTDCIRLNTAMPWTDDIAWAIKHLSRLAGQGRNRT